MTVRIYSHVCIVHGAPTMMMMRLRYMSLYHCKDRTRRRQKQLGLKKNGDEKTTKHRHRHTHTHKGPRSARADAFPSGCCLAMIAQQCLKFVEF